jgi:hypothetical protein
MLKGAESIASAIDEILTRLRNLPPEEYENGWTERARTEYVSVFERLRRDYAAGRSVRQYVWVSRDFNADGVFRGELASNVAALAIRLRKTPQGHA